jgi:hypothetical protein
LHEKSSLTVEIGYGSLAVSAPTNALSPVDGVRFGSFLDMAQHPAIVRFEPDIWHCGGLRPMFEKRQ